MKSNTISNVSFAFDSRTATLRHHLPQLDNDSRRNSPRSQHVALSTQRSTQQKRRQAGRPRELTASVYAGNDAALGPVVAAVFSVSAGWVLHVEPSI